MTAAAGCVADATMLGTLLQIVLLPAAGAEVDLTAGYIAL